MMSDFQEIPGVYIKEEPQSDEERKITEEPESVSAEEGNDEKENIISANTAIAADDAEESLPESHASSDDDVNKTKETSDINIFEPEISIESGNVDINYENDSDFDDEHEFDPSDDEYTIKKAVKKDERERKHQCPICGKFFLTSSAMNGHVAKGHGTTLGLKFTCHVCGAPGSSRASLKRHLIRTHKIKNVDHPELLTKKCTHCGIGFASHLLLYEHIRSDHKENLSEYHNCSWCPALMRAKASLHRHIRRTHPGKEDPFLTIEKCPFCDETFTTRPQLQRHMKNIHPDTPRHVCDICNAGFKFPYMLSRHKMSHDDPEKYEETRRKRKYSVECEFCGRKFGSKPRLEYHIQVVHTNPPIKIYTCRMCGLTFPTAKQNNRHYRKVHRPERQKIHCGKCNITFNTPEECSEHRALHPNTCDVCQKQFLRRDSLREHLLIHSAPRHQCPHCTKKFTQRSNLKRHIRVHTGEKPYKCTFCNRCFSDKSACNSHIRVHTGYERSVCSICGASFSKKQRLNYHMRIHTGEGLLYCPLCMRPSTNSYSLRKHIESHQQPLTKALISVGFKPLLTSDPNFVMRALQALTHATLQSMSRHENIPNSFIEEVEELRVGNKEFLTDSSLEKDVEECAEALTDIARIDSDETGILPTTDDDGESNDGSPFSLTKFLQGILEKESQKVRIDRRDRKDGKAGNSERGNMSSFNEMGEDGEEYEEEEELPATIGDELVKQCLEIIMKDEQSDDDEDDYEDCGVAIKMEPEDSDNEFVIKTEKEDEYDFGSEEDHEHRHRKHKKIIEENGTSKPVKEIPKIKISRIAKTDRNSSEDFFVAEIIKKC